MLISGNMSMVVFILSIFCGYVFAVCYNDQDVKCSGRGFCHLATSECWCYDPLSWGYGNCLIPGECICALPMCNGTLASEVNTVCNSHGSCENNGVSTWCDCDFGYLEGIYFCGSWKCYDIIMDNTSHVCNGHGVCNGPNNCTCADNWVGDECKYPICEPSCQNNGECIDPDLAQPCDCSGTGFSGATCEVPVCDPVCVRGECSLPDYCNCTGTGGYEGDYCETPICSSCIHGECIKPENCSCHDYWDGSTCEIPICEPSCKNGTCESAQLCKCWDGYEGPICDQISNCSPSCGYGICNHVFNNCTCTANYTGSFCNISICDPPCINGECAQPNFCNCTDGWKGNLCEIPICNPLCVKGDCVNPNNCSCEALWRGNLCDDPICQCHHGTCSGLPENCECPGDWHGELCEIPVCYQIPADEEEVCSGRGNCTDPGDCDCYNKTIWGGSKCNVPKCFGLLNSDNACGYLQDKGDCVEPDNCKCNGNFIKPNCSTCIKRENYDGERCDEPICYGLYGESACNGLWGDCSSEVLIPVHCERFNVSVNSSDGRGIVYEEEVEGNCTYAFGCVCKENIYGEKCEEKVGPKLWYEVKRVDSGLVMNVKVMYGVHKDLLENFTISVEGNFNCSLLITNEGIGHPEPTCRFVMKDSNMTEFINFTVTDRSSPFFSVLNETKIVTVHILTVKQKVGQKVKVSGSLVGSLPISVCSGEGDLIYNKCICNKDYYGETCNVTTCKGKFSNETSNMICSNHGTCESFDTCQCFDGYYGKDCGVYHCYGWFSNDTSYFCSGFGDCVDTNNCTCDENYFGSNCNQTYCGAKIIPSNEICPLFTDFDFSAFSSIATMLGGTGNDTGLEIFPLDEGGYIVCGETLSFGNRSMIIARLDNILDVNWVKTLGVPSSDFSTSCARASDGIIVMVSENVFWSRDNATFRGEESTGSTQKTWIVKFSSDGNVAWGGEYVIGTNKSVDLRVVTPLSSGGYLAVGSAEISFSEMANITNTTYRQNQLLNVSDHDFVALILDEMGEVVTSRLLGDFSQDNLAKGMIDTSGDNLVLVGKMQENDETFAVVYKYDSSFKHIWGYQFGDESSFKDEREDTASSVAELHDGGLILVGHNSGENGFLVKISSEGEWEWSREVGEDDSSQWLEGVLVDEDGGVIAVGYITEDSGNNETSTHTLAMKYHHGGTQIWCRKFVGTSDNKGFSVTNSSTGVYAITGIINSNSSNGNEIFVSYLGREGQGCSDWESCDNAIFSRNWSPTVSSPQVFHGIEVSGSRVGSATGLVVDRTEEVATSKLCVQCKMDYYNPPLCDVTTCNGTFSNMSKSCGIGYLCWPHEKCSVTSCFGELSNETACTEHGNCIDYNHCECFEKYFGEICNVTTCHGHYSNRSSQSCSGRGDCINHDECHCDPLYFGKICNFTYCHGKPSNETVCSSHGTCFPYEHCNCVSDWYGEYCNTTVCFGILSNDSEVCNSHGSCVDLGDCECNEDEGYCSSNCTEYLCDGICNSDPERCSSHGECVGFNDCDCDDKYSGKNCHTWYCFDVLYNATLVCNGRGNCTAPDTCVCDEVGKCGKNCDKNICNKVCETEVNKVCSSHGTCVEPDNCTCDTGDGYFNDASGSDCLWKCYDILRNDVSVCNFQNGSCNDIDNCTCNEGYSGEQCEIWYCDSLMFNDSLVCSGHGFCEAPDFCVCESTDYYPDRGIGNYCDKWKCFGEEVNTPKVCNYQNGTCSSPNNCTCAEGYYGKKCEIWECDDIVHNDTSNVCNFGNGTCVAPNKCDCTDGYYSQYCTDWNCWDVHYEGNDDVCGGHGECIGPNDCECTDPAIYLTQNCTVWQCNGAYTNQSFMCSNHGECVDDGKCECVNLDYTGNDCQFWSCYDIPVAEVGTVCGGHGSCVADDVCFCTPGYSSEFIFGPCTIWYCGEISNQDNDVNVCTGRGTCIGSHLCECSNDYEGNLCQTWSCGFDKDSHLTCSGHGECKSPSECECQGGYGGDLCSKNLLYGTVMAPILGTFGFFSILVFVFVLCCVCGCVCCCACLLIVVFCGSGGYILIQKLKMKKFSKLKNLDIILKEQEREDDTSIAHIKINKSLFEIPYDEIKIGNILGEGGSQSVVFKAKWRGETVAFKCFKTRIVMGNQGDFDDFEKEVQILSSLNHPHIIRFFGATMKPPRVGIVMEFCSNGELFEFFSKYTEEHSGKKYPINEKIRVIGECVNALSYCHSRNIIHRDLKCENVLVDHKENSKLMDFGLSKVVEKSQESQNMTRSVGTSIYMAPEIVTSDTYDSMCDVFSFSIMFFVIVTENEKPYGKSEYRIEFKVANDRFFRPNLNELDLELKNEKSLKWIKYIIKRCWADEPKMRLDFMQISELFREHLENVDHSQQKVVGLEEDEEENVMVEKMEKSLIVEDSKNEVDELKKELEVMKISNKVLEKECHNYREQMGNLAKDMLLMRKQMEEMMLAKKKKGKRKKKKKVKNGYTPTNSDDETSDETSDE